MSENRVKRAIDTDLSGLRTTARQREQIVQYALEGQNPMSYRSKFRFSIVLAIVLVMLTVVTGLAVGLTNYFDGFMRLEEEYGEYEEWPGSAKVQLVELMLESGALTAEDTPQWTDHLTGEEKEAAAEDILGKYFDGMLYINSYNVMERELGPIETWTDEQRAMLTELQEKHGKWTPSWPAYKVPATGDLTREQAVAHAREALLMMFDINADYLNALPAGETVFRAEWNTYGIPEDEPYWTIRIGSGSEGHWVDMTREGRILALSAPGTTQILWGEDILSQSRLVEPGEHDATREQAILASRSPLTELGSFSLTDAEVDAMTATAQLLWNDHYQWGDEPVWIVTWSVEGNPQYQVLLTYDAQFLDAMHYGKLFRNTVRSEQYLDNIVAEMLGVESYSIMSLRNASFEEQAAFYKRFKPVAEAYAAAHPYFEGSGHAKVSNTWQFTRNVLGVPDSRAIPVSEAVTFALDVFEVKYGFRPEPYGQYVPADARVFYITTDPEHPQYRFIHAYFCAAVDAYTGEVLRVYDSHDRPGRLDEFIGEIIP